MNSEPVLRIVILNYNTRDLLADCLRSVLADDDSHRWHVVVVDNASEDGSGDMVRRQFPQVTLIESEENLGFAGGNNLGTQKVQEPYILFLNSDTVVPQGAITKLLDFMRQNDDCVAVGPRLEGTDGETQYSHGTFPGPLNTLLEGLYLSRIFPKSRFFGRPRMTWLDPEATAVVDYVSGAAMMVETNAYKQVGGWPEEYFFYAEDADLCAQLSAVEGNVFYHGEVTVTHIGGASAEKTPLRTTIEAHRSVLLFSLRHGGPLKLLLHRIATVCVTLPRLLVSTGARIITAQTVDHEDWAHRVRLYSGVIGAAISPIRTASFGKVTGSERT